jgi:hypothetical protein
MINDFDSGASSVAAFCTNGSSSRKGVPDSSVQFDSGELKTSMAVSLTKIVDGRAVVIDTLLNQQTVKCPRCEQPYRLGYSDDEWHRLSAWLGKAERAVRENHKKRHDATTLELQW